MFSPVAPIVDLNTLCEQQREQKLTPQLLQFLWKKNNITLNKSINICERTSFKSSFQNEKSCQIKIRGCTLFFKTENAELHWKQFPVKEKRCQYYKKRDLFIQKENKEREV